MEIRATVLQHTPVSVLGEGPLWHPALNEFFWVDITGGNVHRFRPDGAICSSYAVGCMVGTVVPLIAPGLLLLATECGLKRLSAAGELTDVAAFPEPAGRNNRFNDGKCDAAGRLWVGSMNKQAAPGAGTLYCFDGQAFVSTYRPLSIPNGMDWTADGQVMFHVDSFDRCIYAFDFDLQQGELANRREVFRFSVGQGTPDGLCTDEHGRLWVAMWGGASVLCLNLQTREVEATVHVDAPHVSSCCFGGSGGNTLFITTAREGLSDEQLEQYPLSGCVFTADLPVKGTAASFFPSI